MRGFGQRLKWPIDVTARKEMFELEKAIQQWQKKLMANPSLEDGFIAELEIALRDEVADMVAQGIAEEESFRKVVAEMGQADDIGSEFHKVYSVRRSTRPSWQCPRFMPEMIWHSFKIGLRILQRHKFYSLINMLGLAVGIACCLLIFIYVMDELSYDAFHEKADRIYRIVSYGKKGEETSYKAAAGPAMAKTLVENYPEVENAVRFRQTNGVTINYKNKNFVENRIIFSDQEILEIFTIHLIAGNPKEALKEPYSLIMSEITASRYFGSENPVGEVVKLNNRVDYFVTGVFKEIPRKSHCHFDVILSMEELKESKEQMWVAQNFNTYILLREGVDSQDLEAKFPDIVATHLFNQIKIFMGSEEWAKTEPLIRSGDIQYGNYLQPLRDIHLHSNLRMELEPNSDIKYVHIFSLIAVFILVVAVVNYFNLSTARSAVRSKEVGLRKIVGASRSQLIRKFLIESLVVALISLTLAVMLISLALPYFNHISSKALTISDFVGGKTLLAALAITLLTGLLGGLYPAFFLSRFRPVSVLRGQYKSGLKGCLFRRILVVFQFATSLVLIIGALIIFFQLRFILNKDLGFNKEQVLILEKSYLLGDQIESFKHELLKNNRIINVTVSGFLPVKPSNRNTMSILPEGKITIENELSMQNWIVDQDYIKTLSIKILKGRDFSRFLSLDATAAIINQRAEQQLGWIDPIGKSIGIPLLIKDRMKLYTIIGVVEDFHFEPLRDSIGPLVLVMGMNKTRMCIRIETQNVQKTIDFIRDEWNQFAPGQPFEYAFLDRRYDAMYRSERRTGEIIGFFSVLSILISGLGLFGLATYVTEQRTKEIGIRRVVGASIREVVLITCKDFIKPVIIANLFAWPLAYYILSRWLQRFAYRIQIGLHVFVFAAAITFIIALATVSWQAFKAATANPVKALRYE